MIAVGLVLSAVFVPCAFISGITGQFFRQFALTISVSTIISAFNSLTLSPALDGPAAAAQKRRVRLAAAALAGVCAVGGWLGWDLAWPRAASIWSNRPAAWRGPCLGWSWCGGAIAGTRRRHGR